MWLLDLQKQKKKLIAIFNVLFNKIDFHFIKLCLDWSLAGYWHSSNSLYQVIRLNGFSIFIFTEKTVKRDENLELNILFSIFFIFCFQI